MLLNLDYIFIYLEDRILSSCPWIFSVYSGLSPQSKTMHIYFTGIEQGIRMEDGVCLMIVSGVRGKVVQHEYRSSLEDQGLGPRISSHSPCWRALEQNTESLLDVVWPCTQSQLDNGHFFEPETQYCPFVLINSTNNNVCFYLWSSSRRHIFQWKYY